VIILRRLRYLVKAAYSAVRGPSPSPHSTGNQYEREMPANPEFFRLLPDPSHIHFRVVMRVRIARKSKAVWSSFMQVPMYLHGKEAYADHDERYI
jgi:hypothetical protein